MDWIEHRVACIAATVLLAAACGDDSGGDETGANASTGPDLATTTMVGSDSGSTDSPPADSDSSDSSDSSSSSGEPPEDCPAPDDTVSAEFSVEIDNIPVVIDYSEFQAPGPGTPDEWQYADSLPEIDSICDVVEQTASSLTVTCIDTQDAARTFALDLGGSEPLRTDVAGAVHVWYLINADGDMLEHVSDSIGHAFVVSDDDGIVLAGIDGRYSFNASLGDAWPESLHGDVTAAECLGNRGHANFELPDGTTLQTFDGSANDLGPYRVLVETAVADTEFDGEFDIAAPLARWLIGLPR